MKKNGLYRNIFFLSIQPFMRPLFSGQQKLSKLDYYFQDGGKMSSQTKLQMKVLKIK